MKCPKCGKDNPPSNLYCYSCWTELRWSQIDWTTCPNCKEKIDVPAQACPHCGSALTHTAPHGTGEDEPGWTREVSILLTDIRIDYGSQDHFAQISSEGVFGRTSSSNTFLSKGMWLAGPVLISALAWLILFMAMVGIAGVEGGDATFVFFCLAPAFIVSTMELTSLAYLTWFPPKRAKRPLAASDDIH